MLKNKMQYISRESIENAYLLTKLQKIFSSASEISLSKYFLLSYNFIVFSEFCEIDFFIDYL